MSANVSRRGFVKLVTDALWSLPVVTGGVLATAPKEALADEVPQSETPAGSIDSGAPGATIIVLQPSEVGFYVVDMGSNKKTPIAGAHVRVTSRYNGEVAEGDTDDLGMLALDISALAENPNGDVVPKEYACNASLEITREGYRNFKTGILRLHGAKGHYIPTRKLEPRIPYPELVTFDEWDALYTQNVFNIGLLNTMTHALHIRILNIGEDDDTRLMLYDKTSRRILHEVEDFSDDGVIEGSFTYKFLLMDGPDAFNKDMELAVRFEVRNTLYEFPLAIKFEDAIFDEPTEVKDIVAKPIDTYFTEGVDVPMPGDFPLGGGLFQMWLPEFPVSIFCDPSGYVQLTMKTPSFGYQTDFGGSAENGWQFFPRQSVAEQCSEMKAGWDKALSSAAAGSAKSSGVLTHAKFSPKLTATVNVQFIAIANWVMDKKYFQGDAVMQFLLSMVISLTEQFFAGPVPMFINFTFIGQAMANYGVGFTVPLPEGDKHPNLVHVISAIDKYQWDYTNTGLSFQFLIKPNLSVGVGVKGVVSVCLRGQVTLTYFIGVTYRGDLDKKTHPLPHQIATYAFKAEVIIEFFLFTRRWTLWKKSNPNWYDNWKGGVSAEGVDATVAESIAAESVASFLAGMTPVTDDMLRASKEFKLDDNVDLPAQEGNAVKAESDDGEAAPNGPVYDSEPMVVTSEYSEDGFTGPDGSIIPCVVYTVGPASAMAAKTEQTDGGTQSAAAAAGEATGSDDAQTGEATQNSESIAGEESAASGENASQAEAATVVAAESDQVDTKPEESAIQSEDEPEIVSAEAAETATTTDDAAPIAYAIPSYTPLWDHDDSAIRAEAADDSSGSIGDDPDVAGIGDRGGIRPSIDVRMFDEPIYGNPRIKIIEIQGEVIALRIGSALVDGEPRTRLIATVVESKRRPTGRSQVLDFPLTQNMLDEGYNRKDLYDYEFSATPSALEKWDGNAGVLRYRHCLQVVVVSGLRNTSTITHAATDLVFSYIQFQHNGQEGGDPFSSIYSYVSWPGSKLYHYNDGFEFHCISNVHIEHTSDPNHNNTEYVFYLDRAGNTEEEALGEEASVRLGIMLVRHQTDDLTFKCAYYSPSRILEMMGPENIDPTAYELVFWPTIEGFRYFMLRGLNKAAYFTIYFIAEGLFDDGLFCFATTEGSEVYRFWKAEQSDLVLLKLDTPKFLVCKSDGQLGSVHVKNPYQSGQDNLNYADIGPAEFGASSFGIYGDFVYWPTARVVDEDTENEVSDDEVVDVPASNEYRIMASRLWNNKFSDPFILAEINHRIDNIVNVTGTGAALTVVSSEVVDADSNTGALWYTSVPFVRTATITAAECDMPFVVPGGIAEFFVTIRNDGNTYIKGCAVEMYDEADKDLGDEWEPCGYAQVGFEADNLVASVYNPPDADGNPTDCEEDGALAPGKCGVYRTLMMVPMEWEGSHRITFVAGRAWYDMVEDFATEAEAEANEDETGEDKPDSGIRVVYYQVKPGEIPMDVLTVRASHTEKVVMNDAPVSVITPETGGTPGGGSDSKSGVSRTAIPNTGDASGSSALAGGLAAAGAAALAYERRRAKNEQHDQQGHTNR